MRNVGSYNSLDFIFIFVSWFHDGIRINSIFLSFLFFVASTTLPYDQWVSEREICEKNPIAIHAQKKQKKINATYIRAWTFFFVSGLRGVILSFDCRLLRSSREY